MDFNYSPEDEAFRQELRSWLESNRQYSPPPREMLGDEDDEGWKGRVRWHKKLNEGGWVAVHWPREFGGRGATVLQRQIFREELERLRVDEPFLGMGISLLGPTVMHWGTEEQKQRYLPKMIKDEEVW